MSVGTYSLIRVSEHRELGEAVSTCTVLAAVPGVKSLCVTDDTEVYVNGCVLN